MYRIEDLQNCLKDAVAFRQNKNPRYNDLDDDLITSSTGLLINHPLVTVENVNQTLEYSDGDYYADYLASKTYLINEKVKIVQGPKVTLYISLESGNTGNDPVSSPTKWKIFDPVSEFLREKRMEAVNEVIEDVIIKKKVREEIQEVFENVTLHKGAGKLTDKEIKEGRFVGYEIEILGQDQLTAIINRIGLQFDSAEAFDLLLFHSSRNKAVATIPISISNTYVFDWITPAIETILSYTSSVYETGGKFFLGYKESDITGQAIIKKIDVSSAPCGNCNRFEGIDYNRRSKYLAVRSFYIPEVEMTDGGLWNIENTRYVTNTNWGLNLDISMRCDLTDFLCRNANMLANIIKLKTEINILKSFVFNSRDNEVSKKVKPKARYSLDDTENLSRLPLVYDKSLEALNFDLTSLGSVCFPCSGPRKISRKVV